MSDRKTHWEGIYHKNPTTNVSWFQKEPALSLQLIRNTRVALDAPIIDVGGGASVLVDYLCAEGYTDIGVLDISNRALSLAKHRLAGKAGGVTWFEQDVTSFTPPQRYRVWHDRAVFHFLTEQADREKYVGVVKRALEPGGSLIIMAFAIGGPMKCSGLDIVQYNAEKLTAEFGGGFELAEQGHEVHITPAGKEQNFAYFRFTI